MDPQSFYKPRAPTARMSRPKLHPQSDHMQNKSSTSIIDLTAPTPEKTVAECQTTRDDLTRAQGNLSIVKNNVTRKTSSGPRNNDDDDYLPEVEDLISEKHWRKEMGNSSFNTRHATTGQLFDNRSQEGGLPHDGYRSGAGTRVSVNGKDKLATPNTGKPYSGPSHHDAQSLKPTIVDDQAGFTSISSILSNSTASHPGANSESTNGINSSQSPNDQNHYTDESANKPDQEVLAFKSRHHKQRQRNSDSSHDTNSIRSSPLGSQIGKSARPTPSENSNQGNPQRTINGTGVRGEESAPDRSEAHRSSSGSDSASNHTSNQNANTLREQGIGPLNGLDCAQTTGIGRSNSRDELAGELQDESAVGVRNFCAPSPTEVDTDDVYGKYLRNKGVTSRQDGDQHSEQTHSQSNLNMEHCVVSNLRESDASTRRAYPERAHQENAIHKHDSATNVGGLDPVYQSSPEQQSQYAPLQVKVPLSSIDALPQNSPVQKRTVSSINSSVPPQSAKRRKSSRGKTVKAKKVKNTGQLQLLRPHKEKMLLYAYPPNEKNNGYTVECVEAVQLTDDGSMLSTVKWTSLQLPMDSLVGEEYHSQFESLFKTNFGEKVWDLQREKRLQKMRRYPRHGKDNDYIVEHVEALDVAEDGSVRCTVRWASSVVAEDDLGEDLLKQAEILFKEKYGVEKWEQRLRRKQEATK
ncbi:hypothetical protein AOQ84DRAFT_387584 [Glonium stellatum]|uniref:Uncharacterized protein n=1 Tax=Glonium stellatum TaxID=574774 RepID=A0A8E2F565_9PEZI|nr:hypothetical protein AOQ84DRAFT_387584 [Glonium stellatum]